MHVVEEEEKEEEDDTYLETDRAAQASLISYRNYFNC